jgi:uncharacterized protein
VPAGATTPSCRSPCPSPRQPARRFLGPADHRETLWRAAIGIAAQNRLSSLHITFCTAEEAGRWPVSKVLLHRVTQQFHWENRSYGTFDDFLADLSSRKRKMIRKERETAQRSRPDHPRPDRGQIEPQHWEAFWQFYQDTGSRKWGTPYLTRKPSPGSTRRCGTTSFWCSPSTGTAPSPGALNFIGRDTLYGRYWGCLEDHPCLHFELCYYQAIDWAIATVCNGSRPGRRANTSWPAAICRSRRIRCTGSPTPSFRTAVDRYLQAERRAVGRRDRGADRLWPLPPGRTARVGVEYPGRRTRKMTLTFYTNPMSRGRICPL